MAMCVFIHPGCNFPAPKRLKIVVPFLSPSGTERRVRSRFDLSEYKVSTWPWAGKPRTEADLDEWAGQRGSSAGLRFCFSNLI